MTPSVFMLAAGKSVSLKPGARPSTVGPSTMPASISATTAGCLKGDVSQPMSFAIARITTTCTRKSAKGDGSAFPSESVPPLLSAR